MMNRYTSFFSGYTLFVISLFEAAGIVEDRFDISVPSSALFATMALVLAIRLGSWAYLGAAQNTSSPSRSAAKEKSSRRVTPLNWVLLVLVLILSFFYVTKDNPHEMILEDVLPEIEEALGQGDVRTVYEKCTAALEAEENEFLRNYLKKVTRRVDILTNTEGVDVYFRFRFPEEGPWVKLGKTPLLQLDMPSASLAMRFDVAGGSYETNTSAYSLENGNNEFILPTEATGSDSPGMVTFVGAKSRLRFPGLDHIGLKEYPPFLISKKEATNQEYALFLNSESYSDTALWDCPVVLGGVKYSCEDLLSKFVDETNSPGPAHWKYSNYPRGQKNYPVTGISWFEASAFARFKGMALPSTYQWSVAASLWSSDQFVPQSNFSKNQLQVVGDEETENQHGLLDIAGNVREWASNSSGDGGKAVLGGCYLDEDYSFNLFYSQPALDRRKGNGVRLVKNLLEGERFASSRAAIDFGEERDIMSLPSVSDEVFAVYRAPFDDYHKTLNPVVSGVDLPMLGTTVVDRVDLEDVTADADRTLPVYVFRDSKHQGQYKPIIYFPGAGSINTTSTDVLVKSGEFIFRHLLAEGYAVFHPVYSSTYEKRDEIKSHYPNQSQSYADHVLAWGQEFKKTIDYIDTLEDMIPGTLSYYGTSWGGYMGNTLLAIDDRVNAAVLYVAGLCFQPSKKNVEAYLFSPRVTCPLLMLNGKYDMFFPLETSQKPMFELIGTAEVDKKHYVYPSGHYVPRDSLVKEHLGWLDKYIRVESLDTAI